MHIPPSFSQPGTLLLCAQNPQDHRRMTLRSLRGPTISYFNPSSLHWFPAHERWWLGLHWIMNLDQSNMVSELNLLLFCANFWNSDSFISYQSVSIRNTGSRTHSWVQELLGTGVQIITIYTKETFHAKMGTINDRNGRDLTEAEEMTRIHRTILKRS